VKGIILDNEEFSLEVGQTENLTVIIEPHDAESPDVEWETSDAQIATVDIEGRIIAVSPGAAVIYAKTADGKFTASASITVKETPVQSISLNKGSVSLNVGKNTQLVATMHPVNATNKNIIWSSSDPKVATVSSDGTVKAIAPGSVKITVKTQDGTYSAKCSVSVKANTVSSNTTKPKYPIVYKNPGPHSKDIFYGQFDLPPNTTTPYKVIFRENKMGYMTIVVDNGSRFESHDLIVYLIENQLYFKRNDHNSWPLHPSGYGFTITVRETGQLLFTYIPQ
jgi:transglutaminase/protease-like cytokinesis protein 3